MSEHGNPATATPAAPPPNSNVTQATFLQFVEELNNADQAVAEAVGMRKDIRKRARGAGLVMSQVDRARKEADKSGDKREMEDREYRRYMMWFGKPLGYQADWIEPERRASALAGAVPNGEDIAAVSEHQQRQVELAGRAAGEAGRDRGVNPWSPGTQLYDTWDASWLAGQDVLARKIGPSETSAARKRGRPPGARNKPKSGAAA